MRILKKILIVFLAIFVMLVAFYAFYLKPRHVVPILMYHAINNDTSTSLNVKPDIFSRQIAFLQDEGYNVISLKEYTRVKKKKEKFPPKTVVITFDDGFEDNYLYAFPVLARYQMPATIFLITNYVGKRDGYLTWDQVILMKNNGIDFGGHTRDNVYLPSLKDESELWDQIALCRQDISRNAGYDAEFFCYPSGGFNKKIKETVVKAGYKAACTTNRGFDKSNTDLFELNRVKITNSDMTKPFHFRAKLSGFYNVFRSLKKGD